MKRFYLASAAVLVIGLAAAALAYRTADDLPAEGLHYIVVAGEVYPVDPTVSKTYVRDLQRFGGKAAVLFDEFNRWFASLWRGRTLALTLMWLTVAASAVLLVLGLREDRERH